MSSSDKDIPELPAWAVATPKRRAHIERVALLAGSWAEQRGLTAAERLRWITAAVLHDALRDAEPAELRRQVSGTFADWPAKLLHGPAAAERLRAEGFADEGILTAITYHTVGHPSLDDAGRALYLADYLEPGRTHDPIGRAACRARMPHDMSGVLRDVLLSRIQNMLNSHRPLRSETLAFWNQVVEG